MPVVTIYSKSWCPYCQAAKSLLDSKGIAYEEIDIERQREARATMIERAGGRTTVPQVFIDGRHVGGYDDLSDLDAAGGLDKLAAA